MTALVALTGWCAAALALVELRRRAGLIADAAHELRGPLGAIALGLELLRRQPLARRRADALLVELARADAAADDVRAGARGRRCPPRPEPIRLDELAAASSEAWSAAAERVGGSVSFDWPLGPAAVHADRRRLAQAFGNLLANAIEHGGGDVVVRARPAGDRIRVEVADAGARPAEQPARPADSARSGKGRGRGLLIARRALDQAGGRLETREGRGGGRVAVAELPLHDLS